MAKFTGAQRWEDLLSYDWLKAIKTHVCGDFGSLAIPTPFLLIFTEVKIGGLSRVDFDTYGVLNFDRHDCFSPMSFPG